MKEIKGFSFEFLWVLKEIEMISYSSNPLFRNFLGEEIDQALVLATRTSRWGILPKMGDLSSFPLLFNLET